MANDNNAPAPDRGRGILFASYQSRKMHGSMFRDLANTDLARRMSDETYDHHVGWTNFVFLTKQEYDSFQQVSPTGPWSVESVVLAREFLFDMIEATTVFIDGLKHWRKWSDGELVESALGLAQRCSLLHQNICYLLLFMNEHEPDIEFLKLALYHLRRAEFKYAGSGLARQIAKLRLDLGVSAQFHNFLVGPIESTVPLLRDLLLSLGNERHTIELCISPKISKLAPEDGCIFGKLRQKDVGSRTFFGPFDPKIEWQGVYRDCQKWLHVVREEQNQASHAELDALGFLEESIVLELNAYVVCARTLCAYVSLNHKVCTYILRSPAGNSLSVYAVLKEEGTEGLMIGHPKWSEGLFEELNAV